MTSNISEDLFGSSAPDLQPDANRVREWLASVSDRSWIWYVKRLSANDTLASGSHQAGPYIPRLLLERAFPRVTARGNSELNPDTYLLLQIVSHSDARDIRLIWYNNKRVSETGTRNEARVTNLGGMESPILDPDATGSLCVFAFQLLKDRDSELCQAWICQSELEADAVADVVGPVEPGAGIIHFPGRGDTPASEPTDRPCRLSADELPPGWRRAFPDAASIVAQSVVNMVTLRSQPISADERLLRRRECEFELFKSVEEVHVLPELATGFDSVDSFVAFANAVTNRRKSRSGKSLELQAREIFRENDLPHSHGEISEGQKRPDFLFPSVEAYRDPGFPSERLRMLAAKTTCKDRWRQILNEADRIEGRYLLTVQEGVSENQWGEMRREGVRLVVPRPLHAKYPKSVRGELIDLDRFIADTAALIGPQ